LPSMPIPPGSGSLASSRGRQRCGGSGLQCYQQLPTASTKTSMRRGSLGASRWARGPHQQWRQERHPLFLQTSTRSGRSAWRSCSRTVISCPPTLHGWQGRDSRLSGRCGDAWDHNPYRSWATSACQGTLVSALRGLVERAKLTQWVLSEVEWPQRETCNFADSAA
jgi:hypothetical protein